MFFFPTQAKFKDPDALHRLSYLVVAVIILWPMLKVAQVNPALLFDTNNLKVMGDFLKQFFPPKFEYDFLAIVFRATLDTLAMASAGIFISLAIAIPLGLVISQSMSISRIGPGKGYRISQSLRYFARLVILFLRGIPEIVWALLFVRIWGLGPMAGVLAIGISYGGMLAKVYSEILESSNTKVPKALLLSGSSRQLAFLYGSLPLTSQELASYTVYRWECAVRASVVMGFVGAGGLGQLMDQSMKMLNGGEVSTILLVFLLLVLMADWISLVIRKQLS